MTKTKTPTAPHTNGRALPSWRIAKALAHPIRSAILDRLAGGAKMSPSELAKALELKLPSLAYHVRELEAAGLIVPAGNVQRRGALEHYYRRADRAADELRKFAALTRAIAAGGRR